MLAASSSTSSSSSSSSSSATPNSNSSSAQPHHNINLKIQNVVASCRVTEPNVTIDLKKLVLKARNAEFQPKRFSAVIMRLREPKSTALIFKSGKMVVLGAKEENQSKIAARKYAKIISLCDVADKVTFKDFRVSNMVAVADCQFPIRLEGLALSHIKFSSYEPELFPGLIYRLENPKLVLLIFVSGKVVLTGAKSKRDLRAGFDKMYYILHEHRKLQLTTSLPPQPQQLPAHLPPSSSSSATSSVAPAVVAGTATC